MSACDGPRTAGDVDAISTRVAAIVRVVVDVIVPRTFANAPIVTALSVEEPLPTTMKVVEAFVETVIVDVAAFSLAGASIVKVVPSTDAIRPPTANAIFPCPDEL